DVDLSVRDGDGVLIRVRRRRAAVLRVEERPAGEVEVPVRRGGDPAAAGVARLVDLFQSDEDVLRVRGIDENEVVVPGLHAGAVAAAGRPFQRRILPAELVRRGDLVPRAADVAARRVVDAG